MTGFQPPDADRENTWSERGEVRQDGGKRDGEPQQAQGGRQGASDGPGRGENPVVAGFYFNRPKAVRWAGPDGLLRQSFCLVRVRAHAGRMNDDSMRRRVIPVQPNFELQAPWFIQGDLKNPLHSTVSARPSG